MKEFANVNLFMDAAVPRKLAQPYQTEEIKDLDDDDDSSGKPGGGGGGNDGLDDGQPPPDPGADIDWSGDEGLDEHGGGDEGDPIDAIGDKILERAEREASGDSEEPGEIIKILKEKKLAPEEIEHWGAGMKGDGKIYLNDDGEFFHLARPIHKYTPEDWKKLGEAEKKAAYKKDKRDKARSAKKERKKAAMGEKAISKAYIQAKLSRVPCWVELPDEAWHPSANWRKFRRPVCRFVKALYGHPDAGTMWEQHCHTTVQKVGFKPLGEEWPSLYFHPDLKLLLVIYVDDLKMAGLTANLPKGWNMLRQELRLEEETPLGLYLGCRISKGEATLHDKTQVQTLTYDMETYLEMTVKKYCDVNEIQDGTIAKSSGRDETSSRSGSGTIR
eukprot:s4236_g8.t1